MAGQQETDTEMAERATSVTPLRPLESTLVAQTIERTNARTDWTPCAECSAEYLPHALRKGLCIDCYSRERVRHDALKTVFGKSERLIQMAESEFTPNDGCRRAIAAAAAFNPETDNLYLHGTVGTGKTHLSARLIGKWLATHSCAYINVLDWIQSLWGRGSDIQVEIARLASVPVLLMDEIAIESKTEFSVRELYLLINGRWIRNRNGLIITSNLDLEGLQQKLGDDRITSRLGGMCRDKIFRMTGTDKRQEF